MAQVLQSQRDSSSNAVFAPQYDAPTSGVDVVMGAIASGGQMDSVVLTGSTSAMCDCCGCCPCCCVGANV